MKFIFPQNYNFSHKLFGFIDYSTAIFNACWFGFLIAISNLCFSALNFKLCFCVCLYLPILLFSIIGINHENMIYVFIYIYRFIKNRRIYFYKKSGFATCTGLLRKPHESKKLNLVVPEKS